jgi:hypothetical protein
MSPEIEQALRDESRTASCVRRDGPMITDVPITIDGKLDEIHWQRSPAVGGMTLLGGKRGRADNQTQARFVYDKENLYAAFVCDEPDLFKLFTRAEKHGGTVWTDDCIEWSLDTNLDKKTYYVIMMNANGVVNDAGYAGRPWEPIPWDSEVKVKAGRQKDAWILEVAVPWQKLGVDKPQKGTRLGMNFCRHQPNNTNYHNEPWSQWSVTFEKSNHIPQRFGLLVLD